MCGIYATNCLHCEDKDIIKKVKQNQRQLRHRGPDCYYTTEKDNVFLAHHRLAIMDISSEANQPFINNTNGLYLSVNGEIYNYQSLYNELEYLGYEKQSESDCEVILPLYIELINKFDDEEYDFNVFETDLEEMISRLDGMFSFVLYDSKRQMMLVARDPFGITSLYYGIDKEGHIHISSEVKAFNGNQIRPLMFPAGHYLYCNTNMAVKYSDFIKAYYTHLDELEKTVNSGNYIINNHELWKHDEVIQEYCINTNKLLTQAVYKRLQSNVPFTMLLSGGLDSSLVCSIACKILRGEIPEYSSTKMAENHIRTSDEINTFSIGFEGSPDLEAAQKVGDYLGTNHHSITITMDEALLAVRDVIWHIETYDVTSIRASTPMFLLSRKIKALGYKMVLSGEGSDEVLGGYLYFLNAPSANEHTAECIRRVKQLQYFDNLRANKSTMAWGLEARVPFLDREFVEFGLTIPADLKRYNGIEKWILRQAFNPSEYQQREYLPQELLWRQKEQFSDGVGYGWIDTLKDIAENTVSKLMMANSHVYYPINSPITKEEYRYRTMFADLYPDEGFEYCVKKWIPNMNWKGVDYDPSGRAQKSHSENKDWDKAKQ